MEDLLGKHLLLRLNHLVWHCAEVEQVEDVNFEYLEVRNLLQRIWEFSLFPAEVSPKWVPQLCCEVFRHELCNAEDDRFLRNHGFKLLAEFETREWRLLLWNLQLRCLFNDCSVVDDSIVRILNVINDIVVDIVFALLLTFTLIYSRCCKARRLVIRALIDLITEVVFTFNVFLHAQQVLHNRSGKSSYILLFAGTIANTAIILLTNMFEVLMWVVIRFVFKVSLLSLGNLELFTGILHYIIIDLIYIENVNDLKLYIWWSWHNLFGSFILDVWNHSWNACLIIWVCWRHS